MPRLCISEYHKTSNIVDVNHCFAMSISKGIGAGITSVGKLMLPDVDMNSVASMLYLKLEKMLTDEVIMDNLRSFLKKPDADCWDLYAKGEELIEGMAKSFTAHEISEMELTAKADPQMTVDQFADKYAIKKLPVVSTKSKALPAPVAKPTASVENAASLEVTLNIGDVVYPINNFFSVQSQLNNFIGLVCGINGDRVVICGVYAGDKAATRSVVNFVTVSKYLFRAFTPTEKEYEKYIAYLKKVIPDHYSGDLYNRVLGMIEEKYNTLKEKETANV